MNQIIYVSDSMKQSVDFINDIISDLQHLGIEDIKHDRKHNFVIVGNTEVRGICVYESCLCIKIHDTKYFIDGIDMRNYENASTEILNRLIYHTREVMSHFHKDAKQLSGKDELIKILTEKSNSVHRI